VDKKLHNLLKDNIDEVILMNQQYFNNMRLNVLYNYERNELTGSYEDVANELEINHNGNRYIVFHKEKDDLLYLKHFNFSQNPKGKEKFHIESRNFHNYFQVLKWVSSNHKFEPSKKKSIFDLLK